MAYPAEFRDAAVQKLLRPGSPGIEVVARQLNINSSKKIEHTHILKGKPGLPRFDEYDLLAIGGCPHICSLLCGACRSRVLSYFNGFVTRLSSMPFS